jgi:hypothetical protein
MLRLSLVFFVWLASTATPALTDTNDRTILAAYECAGADQGRTHPGDDPR